MKALKYGFGLILVGGFALTASCGGSSSDDSAAAGSSSSNAGSSSDTGGSDTVTGGGTTGTTSGGTTGTTSGGAGTTTGGTTTGGAGTTTGGAGTTTGGAGTTTGGAGAMNPAGCPAASTMPKNGDMCTLGMNNAAENCVYAAADPGEETGCRCARRIVIGRGPGGGEAGAADAADGTLTCVTQCAAHTSTPPATGDACTGNNLTCEFGPNARTNTDRCTCRTGKWACMTIGGMGAAGAAP